MVSCQCGGLHLLSGYIGTRAKRERSSAKGDGQVSRDPSFQSQEDTNVRAYPNNVF